MPLLKKFELCIPSSNFFVVLIFVYFYVVGTLTLDQMHLFMPSEYFTCNLTVPCTATLYSLFVFLAGQMKHLRGEIQYLVDQVKSDVTVFRVMDCSIRPLIYNTGSNDVQSAQTVSDLLDSSVTQRTGDSDSQVRTKKSVSVENSQVCFVFLFH